MAKEPATLSPEQDGQISAQKPATNRMKKILIALCSVVVVAAAAFVAVKTFDTKEDEGQMSTVNTDGYVFLSMSACNQHFKDAGNNFNEVNSTCMRLEQELISAQKSGSENFVAMPLECNAPVEDQWYRTDNTFVIDHKNPDTMYVNVEWKGFHKTTDGGKTWELKVKNIVYDHKDVNTGKPCYGEYPVAIMDPNDSNRILLATSGGGGGTIKDPNMRGGGVYETTDGAENWTQKISDTMNGYVTHALVFDPTNSKSFYYGTSASPASYTEADPNKIWVTKGLIYKTPDNGKNWEELPTGFIKNTRLISIMIDPNDPKTITAATNVILRNASGPNTISEEQMGIIRSKDGGQTWARIDNLPKNYQATYEADAAPKNYNHMFFISSVNGGATPKSFYSLDAGVTWNASDKPMDLFAYDPNDASGNRILGYYWQCYGSATCSKTLYQSLDAGKTWNTFGTLPAEIQNLGDKKSRIQNIVWHPTDKNTFFMTGANAYVWKTTDNGSTWTKLLSIDMINK